MKLNFYSAIFYVSDMSRSLEFFQSLGLRKIYEENGVFAKIAFDNDQILSLAKTAGGRDVPGHQTIVIKTTSIQEAYDSCGAHKFRFVWQLCKKPWGKTFIITDPDGNLIEFQEE